MIELDTIWQVPRSVMINGKPICVPFGVDLEPRLVGFLEGWIRDSGIQFAAKRMKSLKTWAIQILAGERNYFEAWFKKTHYKNYLIPKLEIFKYFIDNLNNLKLLKKVLIVLNSHKLVILGEPTLSSIISTPKSDPSDEYIRKLRNYCWLPTVPPSTMERTLAVNTRTKYSIDSGQTLSGPFGLKDSSFTDDIYEAFYDQQNERPEILGTLVPIRDKGKYRNVLVGHWAYQLRYKNLADWLRRWLWNLPEIASGDQSKMSSFCIKSLKEGKFMLSLDLTEATDRLSVDFQIKLLTSMGVPEKFLAPLRDSFFSYQPKSFGEIGKGPSKLAKYSNGQPMGLYISFPMFELAHYVILKYTVATSNSQFCICGDDVVIACDEKDQGVLFSRYENLITRFGGVLSPSKTLRSSKACEGIGAIFLKGIEKEIRIPSGKLSILEATTPGTWVYSEIVRRTSIGRALMYQWFSTDIMKSYTYQQRTSANESLVTLNLSDWDVEALRLLDRPEHMPQLYPLWDSELLSFWRNTPEDDKQRSLKWISEKKFADTAVTNKLVTLYKLERGN